MSRLILLFAIAAVIYLLLKSFRRDVPQQKQQAGVEDMVSCAQCGVHIPVSESVSAGGQVFCSVAHRDAHRR